MQTYYVTVCREYGTVQEEAILKSDHLAALEAEMKEKDKWYAEQWKCQEADRDKKDVEMGKQIATLTILNKQQVGEIAWQFNKNKRLREALKEILNLSHGEGIHIEGQIAQAALVEKDREHAKDITALIKQLQIAGKQIATLKANAEFLSSELERLRSRVVLTPAESHLTLQAALEEGEEG